MMESLAARATAGCPRQQRGVDSCITSRFPKFGRVCDGVPHTPAEEGRAGASFQPRSLVSTVSLVYPMTTGRIPTTDSVRRRLPRMTSARMIVVVFRRGSPPISWCSIRSASVAARRSPSRHCAARGSKKMQQDELGAICCPSAHSPRNVSSSLCTSRTEMWSGFPERDPHRAMT